MIIKKLLLVLLIAPLIIAFDKSDKESTAITLIQKNLSKITSLESHCVSFSNKLTVPPSRLANRDTISYGIREVHNEVCGGEPDTSANIAYIEITDEKIYIFHFICGIVRLDNYSIDMECEE